MAKKKGNIKIKKRIISNKEEDSISKIMKEFHNGTLKDRSGRVVTDKSQVIAMAMAGSGMTQKSLIKSEVINKIKVMKSEITKQLQKMDAREEVLFDNLIKFFKENPNPTDDLVHGFAEKNNIDAHKLEQTIYMILSDILSGGVSKGVNNNFDPEEIKLGLEVEKEHSSIPAVQEKIVFDHLTENPKYYSEGRDKGVFPELENKRTVTE